MKILKRPVSLKKILEGSRARPLLIILSFAVVGVIFLVASRAAQPAATFEAESGRASAGASKKTGLGASGDGYVRFGAGVTSDGLPVKRFFADDASWNQPVSSFGAATDPKLTMYRDRFWYYAGLPAAPGDTSVHFKNYSVPIYDVSEATTTARLFQVLWAQSQQTFSTSGNKIGDSIPWNPNWKPGTGNDRIMHIVNYDTGYQYGLWVVGEPKSSCVDRNIFGIVALDGPNTKAGYDEYNPNHLCLAAYGQYSGLYTTKDGSTHNDRGMGIDKLALVTRADEVKSGTIRHALELTITNTMFGAPECNPNKGYSASGAGTTCGFYLPPATRVEFATNEGNRIGLRCGSDNVFTVNDDSRSKTTPEGIRMALNISNEEIEAWLNSRGYTGAKRNTAKIFAVALRDYGAIIGETGCNGIGIETDGIMNPTTAHTWAQLGITDTGTTQPHGDLLQGLFTRDRLYVVNPPN